MSPSCSFPRYRTFFTRWGKCLTALALFTGAAGAQDDVQSGNVDHAGIISSWNGESLDRGRQIFQFACAPCHGTDGIHTVNPQSRPFAVDRFQNGADPFSLFRTITGGFKNMPSQAWMTPEQRYDVIQYIRETFLKTLNPSQYTRVDRAYLDALPRFNPDGATAAGANPQRDYGPALESQLGTRVSDALTVKLSGDVAVSYDVHRLRLGGAWQGGFLDLSRTGHFQQRGEGQPTPDGKPLRGLANWSWAFNGRFDYSTNDLPPRGPLPDEWMRYRGHYINGWRTVLAYRVDDREILELPGADNRAEGLVLSHTLRINPGRSPLRLCVGQPETPSGRPEGVVAEGETVPARLTGSADGQLILAGDSLPPAGFELPFIADAALTTNKLDFGMPQFSVATRFKTTEGGTLVANAPAEGVWARDAKALYVNLSGRLVYDIGWVGALVSRHPVNDGQWHTAVLTSDHGRARIYIDGRLEGERANFARSFVGGLVFKIGSASPNFGGDFKGMIRRVEFYDRIIDGDARFTGEATERVALARNPVWVWSPALPKADQTPLVSGLGAFLAAGVAGQTKGLTWQIDARNRMILNIPADDAPRVIEVLRYAGEGEAALREFQSYVSESRGSAPIDPQTLTHGGVRLWPATVEVQGKLGGQPGAYALDTIPVPFENPYHAWMRTSALAFFPDGRAVVTTYGGDVWIVSGLDAGLGHVVWSRFAAGLYEPFGARVIGGTIYVTCRNGLVRLHDLNDDGVADFYETFYADPDVSTFFHAFDFDLQVDRQGNLYYVKPGEYTDFRLPGAVIEVSSDGRNSRVYCTGFRVPNGMGMLPDGRLTVSDNQGNWMPASKINLVRRGGFYGYVQTLAGGGCVR